MEKKRVPFSGHACGSFQYRMQARSTNFVPD